MDPRSSSNNIRFYIAMVFAIWFMISSGMWSYLANVFISFPFGIISLLLMIYGKKKDVNKKRYRFIAYILIAGVISSCVFYIMLNEFNF